MKRVISVLVVLCIFMSGTPVSAESAGLSLSAVSAVLMNAETGTVIYAENENEQRAIASTTKIMTALLVCEAGDLDRQFTVDAMAIRVEGTSMGLREGDIVTRRALLYGILLPSGNDAAQAAAVSVSGSISEFVKLMNSRAQQLGLTNTNFANPSGLDTDGHYSTALDMAKLTREAMKNELFCEIVRQSNWQTEFGNPPYLRWLSNSNKLLWNYDGCVGVKTGFTDNARRCLVSAAQKNGVTLIAVTLNAPDDWNDHTKMLNYGFEAVTKCTVALPCNYSVVVVGGTAEAVNVKPKTAPVFALSQQELDEVCVCVATEPFLYGGFGAGEWAGKAYFSLNGEVFAEIDLITAEGVEENNRPLSSFEWLFMMIKRLF